MSDKLSVELILETLQTAQHIGVKQTIKVLSSLRDCDDKIKKQTQQLIINTSCKHFGLAPGTIKRKYWRKDGRYDCLGVIFFFLSSSEYLGLTLEEIGIEFNGINKSNISRRIKELKSLTGNTKRELEVRERLTLIENELKLELPKLKQQKKNKTNNE